MISLFGKWIYAEDEDAKNSHQECLFAEAEEGDWLLVDVELTEDDATFLKDYVVVNEQTLVAAVKRGQNCVKRLPDEEANEGDIEKSQKYFHGKMITRLLPRKMVKPYKILRPLKWKTPTNEIYSAKKLQQMNSWLETLSVKVPRPLGTVGSIPVVRVKVKSLKLPDVRGIQMINSELVHEPVKLQPKHMFVEDLSTAVVKYEPSPVKKLLWDLDNIKRKRTFDFVAEMSGNSGEVPLRMSLNQDHVYDLFKLSIRKRRKSNPVVNTADPLEPFVVNRVDVEPAHTPKPLLALEWQALTEQPDYAQAVIDASEPDEDEDRWLNKPACPVLSDLCEKTSQLSSKLGHQIPRAAMFVWAQILQLLSCSKRLLPLKQSEDQGRRNAIFREPPRGCYLSACCKDFSEETGRASVEKKTKRHDTKKNLKRAQGALTQKYFDNTNRKRAMDSKRFQRACGRRGC